MKLGWVLPIALVVVPLCTLITTYTISDVTHVIHQYIIFISSTIDYPPESCIGTLGLNITVILFVLVTLIRYKEVKLLIFEKEQQTKATRNGLRRLNVFNAMLGLAVSFCLSGVAAFQYHAVLHVHVFFACSFYLGGLIHAWISWILELKLTHSKRCATICRLICIILSSACLVPYIIGQIEAHQLDKSTRITIGATAEIVMTATFMFFFLELL